MPYEHASRLSRREFLLRLAGGTIVFLTAEEIWSLASWAQTGERPSDPEFITRVNHPQDLESPPQWLTSWLTPNNRFFVRSHFGPPSPSSLKDWQLHVEGDVKQRLTLLNEELDTIKREHDDPEANLKAVVQAHGLILGALAELVGALAAEIDLIRDHSTTPR